MTIAIPRTTRVEALSKMARARETVQHIDPTNPYQFFQEELDKVKENKEDEEGEAQSSMDKVEKPYRLSQEELDKMKEKKKDEESEAQSSMDEEENGADDLSQENVDGKSVQMILVVLVVLIALATQMVFLLRKDQVPPNNPEGEFENSLISLQHEYSNQDDSLWNVIRKLGKEHILECHNESGTGPDRPLVFVLTSIKEYKETLTCLSREIGKIFNKDQYSMLDGNDFVNGSVSKAALDKIINEELQKYSQKKSQQLIILTDLGALSYETAAIFFKYCDNVGAPYPKAVFIFTIILEKDKGFLQKSMKDITAEVRDFLSSVAWKDGEKAESDALIARLLVPYALPVKKDKC